MIIGVDIRVLGTGRNSGVEEYTEQLLAHMIPLDPSVHYKLFYAGRVPLVHRPWMEAPNVTVVETGISNRLLWARTRLHGAPYLDELVGGADVFFFPHFLAGATSPACRRVLTIHDLSFERFPEFFSWGRRFWHQVQMRPRVQVRAADRIIAVSESTKHDLVRWYGTPSEKISVIHSGIDPLLHPVPRVIGGKRYILVLGTLEPRKNIVALIRAFHLLDERFHDVELVIAGPKGWLWNEGDYERVRFVGDVDRDERLRLLSSAEMVAYPSLFEGFGFPPLEAMACGTPVLVGANSSMLQVCGDAVLAVNPYSVSQIQGGLEALLGDRHLREMLILRGSRRAATFLWQSAAEHTLEVLR